jgi:hypothetical protein
MLGAVATQLGCGLLILATGIVGYVLYRRIEDREAAGAAAPDPKE